VVWKKVISVITSKIEAQKRDCCLIFILGIKMRA